MLTIRNRRLILVLLIVIGAIAVNIVSRLWRFPAENAFLIVFISIPFVLFLVPIGLAKKPLAHLFTVGFLLAAICVGVFAYRGPAAGPEIPTMYFAVPIIQSVFAILA